MLISDEESPYQTYVIVTGDTDFIVGKDKFENLTINPIAETKKFHYFQNTKKTVVKRFILKRTNQIERLCLITLIKNKSGKFEPRFCFQTNDLTTKKVASFNIPVGVGEDRLIKARVDFGDCHKEFTQLLDFLGGCSEVEITTGQYAVVTADQKAQLNTAINTANKSQVVEAVASKFAHDLTEQDFIMMTKRRTALERFKKLLDEPTYMTYYQEELKKHGKSHRPEDVWQHFFEHNRWIFGYGLRLVACEGLNDHKLETIVVGADIIDGSGKRIDGLLKTRGAINRALFTEIKLHNIDLLEKYDRPAVWVPSRDLRGAVAQIQKTLHKVNLKVTKNFEIIANKDGDPTGETIAFVKPHGIVIAGRLSQFSTEKGTNWEKFSSFELYRQQQTGVEILTYDELYERARYIIEDL